MPIIVCYSVHIMVHIQHILKVHGVQKHRLYNYNVHTYCAVDLWTSMTYSCCLAMQGVLVLCCMVQSRSLSTWHDPCINKTESCHLTLRRAPVEFGGCILRSKLRAAQPNPTKSALLHAQIYEWNLATKARKKTDFAQEINNASYLDHQMST